MSPRRSASAPATGRHAAPRCAARDGPGLRSAFGSIAAYPWRRTRGLSRAGWVRFGGWLAVVWTLMVCALASRYLEFVHVDTVHARIYLVAAYLGHFGLLAALAWGLLLAPLALLVPSRLVILPVGALAVAASLALLAIDTAVYARYRFHLSGFVWEMLTGPGAGEIFPVSSHTRARVALAVLAAAVAAVLAVSVAARCAADDALKGVGAYVLGLWLLASLGGQLMHLWYEARYDPEVTGITRHLPAYRPLTAKRFLAARGWIDPEAARRRVSLASSPPRADLAYPSRPLRCRPRGRAPNLLVVIIDALRADSLDGRVTPNLFALGRHPNAQRFTDHLSGGNATKPGVFSLFYGLPASYWSAFAAARRAPEWIRQHQRAGYRIGVFSSATLLSPAFDRTVFASVAELRLDTPGDGALERDARAVADLERFVGEGAANAPWFATLFLDAAHSASVPDGWTPFRPQWESVDHAKLDPDFDPLPYLNRYRNSLNWLDAQVGALFERMERRGELDDTILIVTSDHGEEFNDLGQNYWGHGSNFARHQTKVPLVIVWPGRSAATFAHRTSHFDVAPTVLAEALGCTNPPSDHSIGASLFDAGPTRDWLPIHSYFNRAFVGEDRMVVTYPHGGYEVLDANNRPVRDGGPLPKGLAQTLAATTRFYR